MSFMWQVKLTLTLNILITLCILVFFVFTILSYLILFTVSVSPEQLNQLQARVTELAERVADMKSRDSIRGDDRLTLFSKVFRSTDRHSRASSKIRKSPIYDGRCAFCRTNTPPITISHIVAGSSDLDYTPFNTGYKTLLDVKSPRNFLPLCGTEGRYGTCHDEFDKFRITLLYNPFDQSYSIFCLDVNNSPKANLHGRKIEVDENFPPYRRLLAWRTRKCLLEHGGKMEDKGNSLFLLAKFSDQSKSVATNEEDEEDDGMDEGSTGSL